MFHSSGDCELQPVSKCLAASLLSEHPTASCLCLSLMHIRLPRSQLRRHGGQEQSLNAVVPWRDTGMTFLFFSTSVQVSKT